MKNLDSVETLTALESLAIVKDELAEMLLYRENLLGALKMLDERVLKAEQRKKELSYRLFEAQILNYHLNLPTHESQCRCS